MLAIPVSPLRSDECPYFLKETTEMVAGKLTRLQTFGVVRNDNLVEIRRPIGPASKFEGVNDIFIFGGFVETVDALVEYATALRSDNRLDELLDERIQTSTLLKDYAESIEMKRHFVRSHHRTVQNLKANRIIL